MSSSNRVRVLAVREATPGVTPDTPRMRTMRITSDSLSFTPEYVDPDEIRADRMLNDPIKVMQASQGGINFELSYPDDESPLSEMYRSAFFNSWQNTPTRFNDGTPDSVITNMAETTDVMTCTTGAAFVAGHLVRFTGFGDPANNGVYRCTTGSATTPAFLGAGFEDEPTPPGTARAKVVGFQGEAGDIEATATGLSSTSLNFTTLGLAVGQWIKIGGTDSASTFAFLVAAGTVARRAAWARVVAIADNALTLDNLPSGWTADDGDGKTIRVFFGDQIRNGVTPTSLSIEKGFMGQQTPTYIVNTGMQVNTMEHRFATREKITGSAAFMGMGGGQSTTPLDASPDPQTLGQVMAGNANVGRLAEDGATLAAPNWARSSTFSISNNLRTIEAVDSDAPVGVVDGEFNVSGQIETYFGSNTLLAKLYAGTPTSLNIRVSKNNQALIFQAPRVTLRDGVPAAGGKNQDVTLSGQWAGAQDPVTGVSCLLDRIEFYEG